MTQPLTPERIAEIRELATRSAPSSYEALTSHRGIEVFAVDPDDCKERIATATPDRKDFVYLAVQAPTVVLALLEELDRLRGELDRRTEDVAFLERTTLPELRREIQHHQDGKRRWQARAEKAEAEHDELKKRATDLENASTCPSVAKLYGTHCALPIRHQGDHRDPEKRHFWSDEHAAPTS